MRFLLFHSFRRTTFAPQKTWFSRQLQSQNKNHPMSGSYFGSAAGHIRAPLPQAAGHERTATLRE
jgi:hypothetical protein